MDDLFQASVKEYLDIVYSRWFEVFVSIYCSDNVCWIGNVPKQIADKVTVNISCDSKQLQADPVALPFLSNCFDIVVLCHEHENNLKSFEVLQEAARVVTDSGILICISIIGFGKMSALPKILLLDDYNHYSMIKGSKVLLAENMQNLRNIDLLYRPVLVSKLFNYLGVLEIVNPVIMPWLANITFSVWQKKQGGEIFDDSSCRLWS